MLKTLFTLDYEIHGNGEGCPNALMIEPTDRLLNLFDSADAKLTIMADVAEILRFKAYAQTVGRDDFYAEKIERQLQNALQRGHDVQLHLHSSYFGANYEAGRWRQAWNEYDFAALPLARMDGMIRCGKQYLETLLRPIDADYQCQVFRAANWSVSPSSNVVLALLNNGMQIDTSVFKYGRRNGRVQFDYSSAFSALAPWRVDADNICAQDRNSQLWEFPIYAELRNVAAFATPQRLYRAVTGRFNRLADKTPTLAAAPAPPDAPQVSRWQRALGPHAWKADFNQCTGRQLIAALERASAQFARLDVPLPFVLIGHSKLFSRFNEWSLRPFLNHVRQHPDRFQFGKFSDFLQPGALLSIEQNYAAAAIWPLNHGVQSLSWWKMHTPKNDV